MSSSRCETFMSFVNFLVFLLSITVLVGGIWLSRQANTECEKFLYTPLIILGVFFILFSLAGLIGVCCQVSWLLNFYFLLMFLLILLLFCFTVFAFVVTIKGDGEVLYGKVYKEYRLEDYSQWLQKRVNKTKNWNKIKSCLQDGKVCSRFAKKYFNASVQQFYIENLSAVQSGCCKPSNDCGFTYMGPTNWNETGGTYTNPDCTAWDNDPSVLCFNCQSCKAGLLDEIKSDWKKVATINMVFLLVEVGCFAYRCGRRDDKYS